MRSAAPDRRLLPRTAQAPVVSCHVGPYQLPHSLFLSSQVHPHRLDEHAVLVQRKATVGH